ncbi:hypothetical protein F0L68_11130 [Solihabitans fulvus]|uniref:Uncharacterized protein n=1 Tax=Solihabitans fulvus TaxID=1892852 RepID=A0A5B2XII3_9PSEU|nr:hypothetical protein [Solihabitans fulvus]KAA2263004.1 hypothetical protein F0L68_11130 [Solihabitans fulvus]
MSKQGERGSGDAADKSDPLIEVTLRPRVFFAVLALVALIAGLVLGLIPVHVAAPDPSRAGQLSCGNAIGGVDTKSVWAGLGAQGNTELVDYINICEHAMSERETAASVLFFGGVVGGLWLGVVRRRREPTQGS